MHTVTYEMLINDTILNSLKLGHDYFKSFLYRFVENNRQKLPSKARCLIIYSCRPAFQLVFFNLEKSIAEIKVSTAQIT